jgi:hypothetical protein
MAEYPFAHSARTGVVRVHFQRVVIRLLVLLQMWTVFGLASRVDNTDQRIEVLRCEILCAMHVAQLPFMIRDCRIHVCDRGSVKPGLH